MRLINAIWLELTSGCNRACPECFARMPGAPVVHHPWSYFEALAPYMSGIEHVNITGGEPLFHPQFDEFAPQWKRLFGVKRLTVWTNGYHARKHEQALAHFDTIWASKYGQDNADEIAWLVKRFGAGYWEGEHIPRAHRGMKPCGRGLVEPIAAFYGGRFYPCCGGPVYPGSPSIAPCEGWREKVVELPLACGECCFSE